MTIITNKRATKKQMLEVRMCLASYIKENQILHHLDIDLELNDRKLTYIFRQGSKTVGTDTPLDYLNKLKLIGVAGLIMYVE